MLSTELVFLPTFAPILNSRTGAFFCNFFPTVIAITAADRRICDPDNIKTTDWPLSLKPKGTLTMYGIATPPTTRRYIIKRKYRWTARIARRHAA